MPVVRILGEAATRLAPVRYRKERQLQDLLEAHPYLLMADDEPDVAFVASEFTLPGTGRLDLLLVDAEGRPVMVEVKLRRNVQSRREVVAQAFDYVAALSEYTARELDQLLEGRLTTALATFEDGDEDDEVSRATARRRWDFCSAALRNGNVRLVVAVDEAGADLVRLVRFVNDHSDLDVRLVEIARFAEKSAGTTLVPKILVRTAQEPARPARARAPSSPAFEAVVAAYDQLAEPTYRTVGRARKYRQIKIDGWPGGLHYEFLDRGAEMGVELHIESNKALTAQDAVREAVEAVRAALPDAAVEFDPKWSRSRGRLVARLPSTLPPSRVAEAMGTFIEATKKSVGAAFDAQG